MPDQKRNNHTLPEHPSEELMSRTLQKMNERLEENRRQAVQQPKKSKTRWVQMGSLAAAAAVLAVFLFTQQTVKLSPASFTYQPDLRLNAVSRTDAPGQSDLQRLSEKLDAALTPADSALKHTDYLFYDFAMNENSAPLWFASAVYEGGHAVQLTAANFVTSLHNALKDADPTQIGGRQVRTGVDMLTGDFFAIWQSGEYYVQMQMAGEGLSDSEKLEAVKAILNLPLMKE